MLKISIDSDGLSDTVVGEVAKGIRQAFKDLGKLASELVERVLVHNWQSPTRPDVTIVSLIAFMVVTFGTQQSKFEIETKVDCVGNIAEDVKREMVDKITSAVQQRKEILRSEVAYLDRLLL